MRNVYKKFIISFLLFQIAVIHLKSSLNKAGVKQECPKTGLKYLMQQRLDIGSKRGHDKEWIGIAFYSADGFFGDG